MVSTRNAIAFIIIIEHAAKHYIVQLLSPSHVSQRILISQPTTVNIDCTHTHTHAYARAHTHTMQITRAVL